MKAVREEKMRTNEGYYINSRCRKNRKKCETEGEKSIKA